MDMPATSNRSAKASVNCAFTTVPVIASISRNEATRSLFCCAAATRARRRKTSERRNAWRKNGKNKMAERLTTYDPAEDLLSDEGMALFMEEAFKTEDASYIAH